MLCGLIGSGIRVHDRRQDIDAKENTQNFYPVCVDRHCTVIRPPMGNPLHHSMEAIPPGNPLLAQFVNQKNAVILSGAAQLYRA